MKPLAEPLVWALTLLVIGLPLARSARRRLSRTGWWLLLTGTAVLLLFSLDSISDLLTYSLESRYQAPSPQVLDTIDVIAVLGGGMYPSGHLRQSPHLAGEAWPRFYYGVQFFRDSGADVLAFCGGVSRDKDGSEADLMKAMAVYLGVPEERIVTESHSRNTMENALGLARQLPPGAGRRIGLVTSALHMRRAERVFKRVFPHDEIVPIPVYSTYRPADRLVGKFTPRVGHLERSTAALHEWLGIAWYAVRY